MSRATKREAEEEFAEEAKEPDLMLDGLIEAVDVGQRQVLIEGLDGGADRQEWDR